MIRLMASVPPLLTPVGVEIGQDLNRKPWPGLHERERGVCAAEISFLQLDIRVVA
jgi:hypothetical protein